MPYNDLTFKVAESYFRLRFPDEDDARRYLPSYAPFHIARPAADAPLMFTLTCAEGLVPFEGQGAMIGEFDCGGAMHGVYRTDDGGQLLLISSPEGEPACALHVSARFDTCRATAYGSESNRAFGINNAVMIAFAFSGAFHHLLMMHASVIMSEGRGYLFLGKSGTGKSTHSGLWLKHIAGADLLNDDNPAVRFGSDGTVTVYGTPWSGKTPCYRNLSVPVGAFVRLEQWPENIIERDKPLQAFASVLSSCSTMIWDKPSYDAILATTNKVATTTPAFRLKCLPDEAAARLCHDSVTACQ